MTYIPTTDGERAEMLRGCGAASIAELFADIPKELSPKNEEFWAADGMSEFEAAARCGELAAQNIGARLIPFLGGGFYDHHIPAAVDAVVSRGEFYTAYTPYQPELSQGTLQAVYEYQTQICRLTGMDVSNASLYDGGTAVVEACRMALAGSARKRIVVDVGVNPIYRQMLAPRMNEIGVEIETANVARKRDRCENFCDDAAAVVLQNPNFFGAIDDHTNIVNKCTEHGAATIQCVNPLALALLKTPAEQNFDIAVGEGQPLGIPLSFGGPYLGFIAVKKEFARKLPGRIAAKTVDVNNKTGFVLSLQAREQHIRREKATSNICTNSALNALRAHVYLSLVGKEGLREVAALCHNKAIYLREQIASLIPSIKIMNKPEQAIFNEFVVRLPMNAEKCVELMIRRGFAAGVPIADYYEDGIGEYFCEKARENHHDITNNLLLVAVTEKRTRKEIDAFVHNLKEVMSS